MYKTVSIMLIGFTAMVSQVVFLREFLVAFGGNELSIGLSIANWLIAGAIGSLFLGRFSGRIKSKTEVFISCQLAVSVLLVLSILGIRSARIFLNTEIGEAVSVSGMVLSSFVIIAPVCIVLAFMFVLACRIYDERSSAASIGMVYTLEAVGSMLGGLLASFILIKLFDSIKIIAILASLNILAGFLLSLVLRQKRSREFFAAVTAVMLLTIISLWMSGGLNSISRYSLKRQWRGYQLVGSENSVYANIAVTKRENQVSFFSNGRHLYTVPDRQTQEEAVHFCLLEHPDPQSILLIGGGVAGLIEEIAKHHVKKIDYTELDGLVVKMAKKYLGSEYKKPLEDPRVSVKNIDARLFIRTTDEKYDCVIIDLGDPSTAQINRYYTLEFFKELKRVLKKDAVVSFGASSSESYMNRPLRDFLKTIYATLKAAFKDVKIIPGDIAYFLGCDTEGELTYDYKILVERINKRNLDLEYVREYYLFSRLSKEKIEYIENSVSIDKTTKINRDFKPLAYYYNMIFQASRFRNSLFGKILKATTEKTAWLVIFAACVAIVLFGITSRKNILLSAVFLTGFSQMAFQIMILFSFQIIYGYVFYKLAIILTSFMIGLAFGGWFIVRAMPRIKKDLVGFIWLQAAVCVYALALPLFFRQAAAQAAFVALPVIAGFIAGSQFPLANKILLKEQRGTAAAAGLTYGIDLLGACLGAFSTEIFLIPILGIANACMAAVIMNFVVLILLLVI